MKTNKNTLKAFEKSFNEYADSSDYDKPKSLKMTVERFEASHLVGRGRNGVSTLVELQKRVTEVSSIHIDKSFRTLLTLRINSNSESDHGFGRYKPVFLEFQKNGKTSSCEVLREWESDKIEVSRFQSIFGYDLASLYPEEFNHFKENAIREIDESEKQFESRINRQFTVELFQDIIKDLGGHRDKESLVKLCELTGFTLKTVFPFVLKHQFSPRFINLSDKVLEFGYKTNNTYNSLPVMIKIEKVSEIKSVSLAKLNIEESGYYSHSDTMGILPESVSKAKNFMSRFKRADKKAYKKLVDNIKKGA